MWKTKQLIKGFAKVIGVIALAVFALVIVPVSIALLIP